MDTIKTVMDTDILINLLRNQQQATRFVAQLEEKKTVLTTTAINIFELYHGAHKSSESERNVKAIKTLTKRLVILPLTTRAAQKAGHIYAQLEQQGTPIGLRDTLIGAIALTREYSVATLNQDHFNRILGLEIISP
jgi:tRNA(fMet)-specific endonuclease VapC